MERISHACTVPLKHAYPWKGNIYPKDSRGPGSILLDRSKIQEASLVRATCMIQWFHFIVPTCCEGLPHCSAMAEDTSQSRLPSRTETARGTKAWLILLVTGSHDPPQVHCEHSIEPTKERYCPVSPECPVRLRAGMPHQAAKGRSKRPPDFVCGPHRERLVKALRLVRRSSTLVWISKRSPEVCYDSTITHRGHRP